MWTTILSASAWILFATAIVVGALELLDLLSSGATAQIEPEPWSPLAALGGVARLAGLSAVGIGITRTALAVARPVRLRR